ncbi:hypothetical protein GCM10010211_73630 [Streptomyces albospinus]|uniref:Uncharacterized protein n=1 Tax=Streptomyces albospinus TaxID=285515 RepID=A0ABQ2VL76_9ACTN|nr:hypothetical protein GCM10010211_73630 [Streptomyces albospinus]
MGLLDGEQQRRHAHALSWVDRALVAAAIVLHPPFPTGGRHVAEANRNFGLARIVDDVSELIRRADLHPHDVLFDKFPQVVDLIAGFYAWCS